MAGMDVGIRPEASRAAGAYLSDDKLQLYSGPGSEADRAHSDQQIYCVCRGSMSSLLESVLELRHYHNTVSVIIDCSCYREKTLALDCHLNLPSPHSASNRKFCCHGEKSSLTCSRKSLQAIIEKSSIQVCTMASNATNYKLQIAIKSAG